jgi:hypothetical protein
VWRRPTHEFRRWWRFGVQIVGLACLLVLVSCARSSVGGIGGTQSPSAAPPSGPQAGTPPPGLQEAAFEAARAGDHKIDFLLDTATRRGHLVYATRGGRTSWRLEQTLSAKGAGRGQATASVSAFVLETPAQTIFCLLENSWRCFEGEAAPDAAPALFDRRSFDFLAIVAPSIASESYKRSEVELAGYRSACFDIVPQQHLFSGAADESVDGEGPVPPLAPVGGVDDATLEALRNSLVIEVLYRGGTLCFGSGMLLKMAILDEELFTITAERVAAPVDADFVPPAQPEPVDTPSPFPSVIVAT